MSTRRIYISLNSEKLKDKMIQKFLDSTYNEAETIKAILYQYALNGSSQVHQVPCINLNSCDDVVQEGTESNDEEQIDEISSIEIDKEIINMFN